jgi:hypothetical protein
MEDQMRSSVLIKLSGLCSLIFFAFVAFGANTVPNLTTDQFHVSGATASTVPYFDTNKKLVSSAVTPTILAFLDATSSIQTQINSLQSQITANALPSQTGNSGKYLTTNGTATSWGNVSSGSGTVTSVTFTGDGTVLSSTPSSAVTTSGTLTAALKTQTANTVLAGPTSGGAVNPTFRALVAGDIPSLSATYLPLTGGTMSGAIAMGSNKVTGVTDPTSAQDAATKNYVDTQLNQLNPAAAVKSASTASITGTYTNAVSGVCIGDTFQVTSTSAFVVDGVTPSVGDRVLFKDQSSTFQDGVWTLTTAANVGVLGALLTRALDSDSSADLNSGQIVPVSGGTVNAGSSWYQTAANTTCNTSTQTWTAFQKASSAYLLAANNLSDVASSATSWNNISGYTLLGDTSYGGSSGVRTVLAGNTTTTKKYLAQTGNGTVSAAPAWTQPACADLSNAAASCSTDATNANNISTGTLAVNVGGTGQTSYTDGQLLIGNTTGNTLTKATITAGSNVTVTNGHGTITIASSAGSGAPTYSYAAQSSTLNPAVIGTFYLLSGSSFNITLPTAASIAGQGFIFKHNGTSLSQKYTFLTTSSQTINGVASGSYILTTAGETVTLVSDGSNWQVANHVTNTGWISDTTANIQYITFTISSGNATIVATYAPCYVFTITSGNTASVGAIYSNNGHNYTLAKALLNTDTSLVTTGPADPAASGTLTYVSGTHTGGNISFSAFAGNPDVSTTTYTVTKTVASGVSVIMQGIPTSTNPAASGQLAKISGTGDAILVYSSFTGTAVSSVNATTTPPVFYGSPTNNTAQWRRSGNLMTFQLAYYQATAGAAAGSGDYLFSLPTGALIDTTADPLYTGGTVQTAINTTSATMINWNPFSAVGIESTNGGSYMGFAFVVPYTSSTYRLYGHSAGAWYNTMGSTNSNAAQIMQFNYMVTLPISDWQP